MSVDFPTWITTFPQKKQHVFEMQPHPWISFFLGFVVEHFFAPGYLPSISWGTYESLTNLCITPGGASSGAIWNQMEEPWGVFPLVSIIRPKGMAIFWSLHTHGPCFLSQPVCKIILEARFCTAVVIVLDQSILMLGPCSSCLEPGTSLANHFPLQVFPWWVSYRNHPRYSWGSMVM